MTEIRESLARTMKERRQALGLSQAGLAERAGISPSYVGEIETCRKFPDDEVLIDLAAALGVRPYRLLMAERDISEVAETAGREAFYQAAGEFRNRMTREMNELFGRLPGPEAPGSAPGSPRGASPSPPPLDGDAAS